MTRAPALALLCVALPASLAACTAVTDAVTGPRMGPMDYPAVLVGQHQPVLESAREPLPQPPTANSLWRVGARTFFNDQRAGRVGDILTVLVDIADSAKTQNTTNTGLTSSEQLGLPNILESTLGKFLPSSFSASQNGTADVSQGTGAINRSEQISLTIAAVVTQVLPNGNLVIQGSQQVKTNNEVRELTVSGIVRPEDISSSNTILSSQIAEARIDYGGHGDISAVQKTPVGEGLLERLWPF